MERTRVPAAVLLAAVALAPVLVTVGATQGAQAAAASQRASAHAPGISARMRGALLAAARSVAVRHGDAHPRDIEAVLSTHRRAEHIRCGNCEFFAVPAGAPVYVVAMRGHFNCNSCSHPRGGGIAPASVITLEFLDPKDLGNVVFAYGGPYPRLKLIGKPVRL